MYFIPECFAPMITLIPRASFLSAPVQFQRSQAVSIVSTLNSTVTYHFRQTQDGPSIYVLLRHVLHKFNLDQTVSTTLSELFIPARSLAYGTYQLQLTVSMIASPNLTSSASIYVMIISTKIQTNLLLYGTSMISLGS